MAPAPHNAPGSHLPEQFDVLQALRAVAALAVLLHHAGHAAQKLAGPMPFIGLTRLGLVGVDLFFVLSGFVILHASVGRGLTMRQYARSRFRRIYLPYWPVGLAYAAYVYLLVQPSAALPFGLLTSVTLAPIGRPALNVAWTLQHELVFYALVGIGLFSGWWRTGLALWCAGIALCWLAGIRTPIGFQPIDAEFLLGAAAWAAWKKGDPRIIGAVSGAMIMAAIGMAVGGAQAGIERAGPIAAAAVFAALLPWLVRAEQAGRLRLPASLRFLGDASYSIYLVHPLTLLVLIPLWPGAGSTAIFLIAAATGLATGIAYHLVVERPLLALMPKRPRSSA